MVSQAFAKPAAWLLAPFLLLLLIACGGAAPAAPDPVAGAPEQPAAQATPVAQAEPAAPSGAFTSSTDRLRLALLPPPHEINRPWLTSGSGLVQHRPMMEMLIGADVQTAEYVPTQLVTGWEMSPDGLSWTLQLREDIPFHFGWGEFTGRDVEHTFNMWTRDEAIQTRTGYLQERLNRIDHIDDHQMVIHLNFPDLMLVDILSEYKAITVMSAAQWEAEGDDGMEARPAGTGSWRYLERRDGSYIRFERVEDHWRQVPEFREMEMRWVPEASTRLAALLAGEVHIADVPRDLEPEAVNRGMSRLVSTQPGIQTVIYMGGLFFDDPDHFDPDVPWTKVEVREALNRAINRQELNNAVFAGDGTPVSVLDFHPSMAPTKPEWEEQFEAMYGYDPERARQLLADAGYPNGFKVRLFAGHVLSGFPEIPDVAETVSLYWQAVGLDVELVTVDFAHVRGLYREKQNHQYMWPHRSSVQDVVGRLANRLTVVYQYEDARLHGLYRDIVASVDPAEQQELLLEFGDIQFYEYAEIPLFFLPVKVLANPAVVEDWTWPGTHAGSNTHTEYIRATR